MDHGLVVVKGLGQLNEHAMQGHPRQTGHSGEFWQNVVHRKEWQLTPVFLPQKSHEQYEKAKRYDTRRWALGPYATEEEQRDTSRKNEAAGEKWKWCSVILLI